jgi:phage baseplate assembly protein gpV
MNPDMIFSRLMERIMTLEKILNRQEVRLNNMFREATVKEADYSKGLAIVEAHGMDSKEVPWMEPAGDIVEWTPVSQGQRVMLVSPGGQMGRGFIIPGGFTDSVPQPHDKGAEKRIKIGNAQQTLSTNGLVLEVGGSTLNFGSDGLTISAGGTTFALTSSGFAQTGGTITHDGTVIDKTHEHTGVATGGANTGPPA